MTVLHSVRRYLEPIVGIVFLLLWIDAEVGRGLTGLPVIAAFAMAIVISRVLPWVALGVVVVALAGQAVGLLPQPSSTDWPVYFGIALVVGLVAAGRRTTARWAALGVGFLAAISAAALMVIPWGGDGWMSWTGGLWFAGHSASLNLAELAGLFFVVVALAWGSGYGMHAAHRLFEGQILADKMEEQLKVSEVELAVAQERNRIAQEMHDVLAHSLAVVIAQADGARYLRPTRPRAVDTALQNIADSARATLGDVRGIIDGILDGSPVPQPGVDELPDLLEGMRSTGLLVGITELGESMPLASVQQLALYRIVQESLTNALRHRGRGTVVAIVLDWRGPGVSILIESSGGTLTEPVSDRLGRGVIGMRERAHVAGGWLTVGLDEDSVHRVSGFMPFYRARALQQQPEAS
jgi:signal transduction histidine kinase